MSEFRRRLLGAIKSKDYIIFEDPNVETICVTKWSKDGRGLTYKDASLVTDFGTTFKGNTSIEFFREMMYFTNMTLLPYQGFQGCTNLKAVNLVNITGQRGGLYHNCFNGCTSLSELGDTTNITDLAQEDFHNTAITAVNMPNLNITRTNYNSQIFQNTKVVNVNLNSQVQCCGQMFAECKDLKYIKMPSMVAINNRFVQNCTNLEKIVLPEITTHEGNVYGNNKKIGIIIGDKLTSISNEAFGGSYSLKVRYVVIKATTPPVCGTNIFRYNNSPRLYVPDASVNAYKATTGFDTYINNIYPISQFYTDFPGEYE